MATELADLRARSGLTQRRLAELSGVTQPMSTDYTDELITQAKDLAELTETARREMLDTARRRQETILSLRAAGLSVRSLADRLGCSPAIVQEAVRKAKERHPAGMRREKRVPFELHVTLGMKLHENPDEIREIGRRNLAELRKTQRAPIAERWLDRWEQMLSLPVTELERQMLRNDEETADLRQISPFAGALTEAERLAALNRARYLAEI